MDKSALNNSISFEIPLDDAAPLTPISPSARRMLTSPNRESLTEADLNEKLAKASDRRSLAIEETRSRNELRVLKAKAVCVMEKEKIHNRSHEVLISLQDDLANKAKRRQEILESKVNSAKKELEKVDKVTAMLSTSRENLKKQMDEDMSNKENNRRVIIDAIKQQSQIKAEKVDQVRSRRSLNNSSEQNR